MLYMKKLLICFCVLFNFKLLKAQIQINWKAFLEKSDMQWSHLPTDWDNAPFIGNGKIGTIFWMNKAGNLHFEIGRNDIYDHRQEITGATGLFTQYRMPLGHFEFSFGNGIPTGKFRLNLWDAETKGQIENQGAKWQIRCFSHAIQNVIVVEITGGTKVGLNWVPDSAKSTRGNMPKKIVAYPFPKLIHQNNYNISVQEMPEDDLFQTSGKGNGQYAIAWKAKKINKNKTIYFISVGFSYPGRYAADEAIAVIAKAEIDGIEKLESSHRSWWHSYYPKSFLSLPDQSIESFYWIQMYKMASASRKNGTILDLMGPWFRNTGWPAIWWNLNIQLSYWPFYMSNHLDEATSLNEALWNQRENLARNAAPYSKDSYAIGRASSPDLYSPVGNEVGNLPWVMHNLWLYYRSSMDSDFLKNKLFPLMKGTFNYLWHILKKESDGRLVLPKTASPEYTDAVENSNYTMACLRWLSGTLITADSVLQTNDSIVFKCKQVISHLTPYEVDSISGFMVGKDLPFAKSHRHWSHLFMIYPFKEFLWNDSSQVTLIKKSVQNWTNKPKAFAGYSWLGGASIMESGGEGDTALKYLQTFLEKAPLPNTMYREGSPVIETPLAFARTLQEMMLNSSGGLIQIFPGIPSIWKDVCFADFRAEGAFLITAIRKNGITRSVKVKSLSGGVCHIATGIHEKLIVIGKYKNLKEIDKGQIEVVIPKGETIIIYSGNKKPSIKLRPVKYAIRYSSWGEKKPMKIFEY